MNLFKSISKSTIKLHMLYWVIFVLFFTVIWGTYDHDYFRNFMVQLWSLPARLVLVYGTICVLIPRYFVKGKYIKFAGTFIVLLIISGVFIQRSIMIFVVQGKFLPHESEYYFKITELMNTLLDVNLALIIPLAYTFYKFWQNSKDKAERLELENQALITNISNPYIYLKKGKALQKIFLKDIIFIESLSNYVKVKTADKEIKSYNSISSLQAELPEDKFLRVHRSFIVSTEHIASFSPSKINSAGYTIPIGRKFKEEVKHKLGYY